MEFNGLVYYGFRAAGNGEILYQYFGHRAYKGLAAYGYDVGVCDQTFTLYEVGDQFLVEVSIFELNPSHSN